MKHSTAENEIAKDLTLKAIDAGFLKSDFTKGSVDAETIGKKIADLFNAIIENTRN